MRDRARRTLSRRDAALRPVIRAAPLCDMGQRRASPYAYLVRSVLYQQLAGSAARAIETRFRAAYGGRVPRAEVLAEASPVALRELGLSRQKAAAMREIGAAFRDGEVPVRRLARMSDDEIVACVTRIRGVGEWTAQMMLMFALGRPDVLPTGDYGVRKGAMRLYGLADLPKPRELEAIAERWRPYRSIASWYLWRATEMVTLD
jgi:DNA-3-methyladenine glycosylase II